MQPRTSAFARILAAVALVAAFLAVIVILAVALSGGGSSPDAHHSAHHTKKAKPHQTKAKTYTVKSGDTLTAIAHETGVPVATILALNPEVDPQTLIVGETLKLR